MRYYKVDVLYLNMVWSYEVNGYRI